MTVSIPLKKISTILSLGVVLSIALSAMSGCMQSKAQERRALSATAVLGESLRVTTANGSVSVTVEPGRSDVGIIATLTATGSTYEQAVARLDEFKVIVDHAEGPVLDVSVDYGPSGRRSSEGCAFDIRLPSVAGVSVATKNGRIELTGTSGAAELQTSNGRIIVDRHDGPILADTSNGSIVAERITGRAKLDTSNGRIIYTAMPETVEPFILETSNGSVQVKVPLSLGGKITARTSNGSVNISGIDAEAIVGSSKDRTITLSDEESDGEPNARIRTSNGSITIEIYSGELSDG